MSTHNGGEFFGRKIDHFYKQFGLACQNTTPYTPQQNGFSERMSKTAYRNDQICFQRVHHHCESSTLYSISLSDFHKRFKIFKYI